MNLYMTREEARKYYAGKVDSKCLEEYLDRLFSDKHLLYRESKRHREEKMKPFLDALKRSGVIS